MRANRKASLFFISRFASAKDKKVSVSNEKEEEENGRKRKTKDLNDKIYVCVYRKNAEFLVLSKIWVIFAHKKHANRFDYFYLPFHPGKNFI